jgi:hypothetical protein
MKSPWVTLFAASLVLVVPMLAKSKDEKILPAYVLTAHTVAVIVDPQAGIDVEDPRANQVAQKDVETAFANWGRFEIVMRPEVADLVIVIRRGHGRLVDDTIPDSRQNNRPGVINPTENGAQIGAQHGQPNGGGFPGATQGMPQQNPQPQLEVGGVEDSFTVYQGGRSDPTDSPAAWRRDEKDGLHSHDVPAVEEFRKAVAAADKAAAAKKP